LGLRWEGIRSPREVNGKLAVLKDIYRDKDFVLLTNQNPLFGITDALKGFSPRVGLAWTPFADQKIVVRSGQPHSSVSSHGTRPPSGCRGS